MIRTVEEAIFEAFPWHPSWGVKQNDLRQHLLYLMCVRGYTIAFIANIAGLSSFGLDTHMRAHGYDYRLKYMIVDQLSEWPASVIFWSSKKHANMGVGMKERNNGFTRRRIIEQVQAARRTHLRRTLTGRCFRHASNVVPRRRFNWAHLEMAEWIAKAWDYYNLQQRGGDYTRAGSPLGFSYRGYLI